MRVGHVAVVDKIVDERHVVLNHANWSRPGMIETSAMAEDVSENGDWSSDSPSRLLLPGSISIAREIIESWAALD